MNVNGGEWFPKQMDSQFPMHHVAVVGGSGSGSGSGNSSSSSSSSSSRCIV